MRKSLNEIQQIESYVFCRMNEQERQEFRVRLLIDTTLQWDLDLQTETYALIKTYGRKKLKAELNAVHEKLFNQPDKSGFRQRMINLFSKQK